MKTTLRALSVLLVLAALFASSSESFGLGRCRGRRCRPAHPTPEPVVSAQPEPRSDPQPKPQPDPFTPKPDIYDVPLPDLSGCDARGHKRARTGFAEKVGSGMGAILDEMTSRSSGLIASCKFLPTSLQSSCCKTIRNTAASTCKDSVAARAANDNECSLEMPACSIIKPGCLRARITEKKRAQCCSYLKPQGTAALLAFCDKAADLTTESCGVPGTKTPEPTWTPSDLFVTPTQAPRAPTATPTDVPTVTPTRTPTNLPTEEPTVTPTAIPTETPDKQPTGDATDAPTYVPSYEPTGEPTGVATDGPTGVATDAPTYVPSYEPTGEPTGVATDAPTGMPTDG